MTTVEREVARVLFEHDAMILDEPEFSERVKIRKETVRALVALIGPERSDVRP